jgi:outer membrane protein assembly factor BamE (lipoprotein component of BamABCDE complex)
MVSGRALRRKRGNFIVLVRGLTAACRPVRQRLPRCKTEMRVPGLGSKIAHNRHRAARLALALACALALAGCGMTETLQRGYVLPEGALEQIPVGASQEQVLIVLGTPSTVATVNGEAFYYISQKTQRDAAFMPHAVVDQRVVAVYFDKERRVERLANYGLRDGKIFDSVSQTTPTGGQELSYLRNIFKNIGPKLF